MKAGQVIDYEGIKVAVPYWSIGRDGSLDESGFHADHVRLVKEHHVSNLTRALLHRKLRKLANAVHPNDDAQIGEKTVRGTRYNINGGMYKKSGVSVFVRDPDFIDLSTDVLVEVTYRIDGQKHPFNPVREVVSVPKAQDNRRQAIGRIKNLERTVLSSHLGLSKAARIVDYPLSNAVYIGTQ